MTLDTGRLDLSFARAVHARFLVFLNSGVRCLFGLASSEEFAVLDNRLIINRRLVMLRIDGYWSLAGVVIS